MKKNTATKKTTTEGRGDEEFCALTHEAESLSYYPPVILAAGRINGGMGNFIAAKIVKMLTWMFNSSVIPVISVVKNPTPPSVVSVGNPRFGMSVD